MIRFRRNVPWAKVVFYWWGGVNYRLLKPCFVYLLFLIILTALQEHFQIYLSLKRETVHAFGSFLVFLLVFRLNQCMGRHKEGKDLSTELFASCESLVYEIMMNIAGTGRFPSSRREFARDAVKERMTWRQCAEMALVTKLNCARLLVALAISFVMHCRLSEGAADSDGELEDGSVMDIVFLYCRLQALLYAEEMEVVDKAICVYASEGKSSEKRVFRAEINRHRLRGKHHGESIFGHEDTGSRSIWSASGTVVPLPKVISAMLMDCLMRPLDMPWGYPQRVMNVVVAHLQSILHLNYRLETLITLPLPLAYLQHCRVLLALFGFFHPFSIDPAEGSMNNIVMPFFLFWAMMGFEELAKMMENPLGADETDLNLLAMVHSLEVACSNAFDMSTKDRRNFRKAQNRPFRDFNLETDVTELEDHEVEDASDHSLSFSHYFHWLPMPSLVLENLFESHGHADTVHAAKGGQLAGQHHIRHLIRNSVLRAWRPHRRSYEAVPTGEDVPPDLSRGVSYNLPHASWMSNPEDRSSSHNDLSKSEKDTLTMLQDDPNVFSDYLVFEGVLKQTSAEFERHSCWNQRASNLLGSHRAKTLIEKANDDDTERSVMDMYTHLRYTRVMKGFRKSYAHQMPGGTVECGTDSDRRSSCESFTHPIVMIRRSKDEEDPDEIDSERRAEEAVTGNDLQANAASGKTPEAPDLHPASGQAMSCSGKNTVRFTTGLAESAAPSEACAPRETTGASWPSVATPVTIKSVSEQDPLLSSPAR